MTVSASRFAALREYVWLANAMDHLRTTGDAGDYAAFVILRANFGAILHDYNIRHPRPLLTARERLARLCKIYGLQPPDAAMEEHRGPATPMQFDLFAEGGVA